MVSKAADRSSSDITTHDLARHLSHYNSWPGQISVTLQRMAWPDNYHITVHGLARSLSHHNSWPGEISVTSQFMAWSDICHLTIHGLVRYLSHHNSWPGQISVSSQFMAWSDICLITIHGLARCVSAPLLLNNTPGIGAICLSTTQKHVAWQAVCLQDVYKIILPVNENEMEWIYVLLLLAETAVFKKRETQETSWVGKCLVTHTSW